MAVHDPTTHMQIPDNRTLFLVQRFRQPEQGFFMTPSPALSEKPENMPPLQPSRHLPATRLALLLSLMLCGELNGCGPASSDNVPNLGLHANVAGPPLAQKSPTLPNNPAPSSANPRPIASDNGDGSASVRTTYSRGGNSEQGDRQLLKSVGAPSMPDIPDSIVKGLDSPDARVRLLTLDHLTESKTMASLDLLFAALEDEDEDVRVKATEIIERHWAAEQGHK